MNRQIRNKHLGGKVVKSLHQAISWKEFETLAQSEKLHQKKTCIACWIADNPKQIVIPQHFIDATGSI